MMQPTCIEVETTIENTDFQESVMEETDCSTVGMNSIWYDSLGD